jgi:mycothiol synthase
MPQPQYEHRESAYELTRSPYVGESDYACIRELLQQTYAQSGLPIYATTGDIDWWRWGPGASSENIGRIQLWWNNRQELAGVVWPEHSWGQDIQVDLLIHPAYRGIEDDLLAWAEAHQYTARTEAPLHLTTWAFTRDTIRIAVLQKRGYVQTNDGFLALSRQIQPLPLKVPLVPGYSLRSVQTDKDFPRRVAIHRAAFAPSKMSEDEYRLLVRQAPAYRADLDLVVVAPDGSFAACCLIWFDPVTASGLFEPVGCHPDHRRRGLTRAVMREGLRRLHDLGAQTALVNAHQGDEAAVRLYSSLGFEMIDSLKAWQRSL